MNQSPPTLSTDTKHILSHSGRTKLPTVTSSINTVMIAAYA